ncbi:ras GTP exchange factor, son of sevenless, putative [Entamoeba invadens IP1]|uniref:Ras GTP exchange factor, son of sevenless, putative n=1 Tax=Entamoeba invadens IP1 TaxID=370355 RepID=A0A0A1U2Q0_ENTIV|nr:ras GTP exchange factor, son of sevenless, putative [Entamoeba invadens IP1]ELP88304.1 ras GTP exchange factor, son of sevenless, putative [Entamoeba invadens IP1]|eukprot:XP_004255075.1 ras GTP exchange factor, son of sevenless, putative [Entamoeba invadens IP1]
MATKQPEATITRETRSTISNSTDFSNLSGSDKIEEDKYNPDPNYSTLFDVPNSSDYIRYTTESGCDFKIIQMATIEKCVQTMLSKDFNDGYFQECFVLAYRLVTTPERLLELLNILFDPTVPEGMDWDTFVKDIVAPGRLKIMNFVRMWMKNAWKDFEGKEDLIDKLQQLITRFKQFNPKMSSILQKQLEHRIANVDTCSEEQVVFQKPLKLIKNKYSNIFKFHPIEFARQITLMQNDLFRKIPYVEFLGNGWTKKTKDLLTPNIMKLVRSTQKLFSIVQTFILNEKEVGNRALAIHYFLVVAEEMRRLNNFEGMKAVFGALGSFPIFRLKYSWEGISSEDKENESKLNALCDQEKNFSKLREVMKIAVSPCIPFLGSTMGDLVFTDDGNKKGDTEKSLINFFKIRGIGNLIKEIMVKQAVPYPFKRNDTIIEYFEQFQIVDDEEVLFDMSTKLEEKRGEMTPELEKKIAKCKKEGNSAIKKYLKYVSN